MKRILAVLFCLLLAGAALAVAAEEPAVVTTVASATTLQRGDILTLTVKVENSPTVTTLAFAMGKAWDNDVFEFVSAKWLVGGAMLQNVDTDKYNAVALYSKARVFDGEILQIELKVKETSGFGATTLTVDAVFESAEAGHPVAPVSAQVEIVCPHSWQAADCAYPEHCTVCGTIKGAALGHAYQGNTCSRCGDTKQEAVSTTTTTLPTLVITTTTRAASMVTGQTTASSASTTTRTDASGSVITDAPTTTRTDASGSVITDTSTTSQTAADGAMITTTSTTQGSAQDTVLPPAGEDDSQTWVFVLLCIVVAAGVGGAVTAVLLRKKK